MNDKYKIGEKIKVKRLVQLYFPKGWKSADYFTYSCYAGMLNFKGKEVTVIEVGEDWCIIEEDSGSHKWYFDMLRKK